MSFIKFSKYQGLHLQDYGKTVIEDTSINSPDYFRITEFPNKLTSGRNAFLLAGNSEAFEPQTELKFECVGVDGRTVYMEVPSWIDGSGNRMISIWVYPWTPKGNGIITLVGRLRNGSIVRWKRLIKIDPFAANVTPLVFGKKPKVFVQEKQKEYLNLSYPIGTTAETQYTTGQISIEYNATSNETTATITGGTFTSDMEGGHLIIASPSYTFPTNPYATFTLDPLTPAGLDNTNQGYDGYITAVINETTAKLNHPFELQNVTLDYASFLNNYANIADQTFAVYQIDVNPSNFTLDYIQTPVYTTGSGNVESYALVTISNLAPISGDADSVITYMRSAGFTEWEKIGDDSLNHKELLIDGESHELTKKMGFFVDQYTMNTYWSSSAHGYTPVGAYPSMSIASGSIMDALRISGSEQLSDNTPDRSAAYIRVNNQNPIEFYADNEYQISFRFQSYTDLYDGFPPELVVYMSGSAFDNVDINGAETDVTLGRKVASVGEENTFSTWQSQVTAIQTNPGFMPGVVGGGAYTNVAAMDAMMVANNPGGQAAAPYFSGQVANVSTAQQSNKSFWAVEGANIIPDPETQTYTFKADKDGKGVPVFQVKAGRWDISQISIKAIALPGFTPNHTFLLSHIPSEKKDDLLDFKWEFKDGQGVTNATYLVTHSMNFSGSNTYIEDALLPGTFNIGQSYAGTGFQFSGKNSAMIRTMGPDYPGFSQATGSGGGGIIMWSGSLGASGKEYDGQSYYGVGMELVGSSSWLRFRTQTGSIGNDGGELDVRTNKFFLGSNSQYISGANGNIEISSSNFHLQNDGDIIMQGTITAEAGGTIGGATINSHSLAFDPHWEISSSTDTSDPVSFISSSEFKVSADGRITASAGKIAGWQISGDKIYSLAGDGNYNGVSLDGQSAVPNIKIGHDSSNYIYMYYGNSVLWGLAGMKGGDTVFTMGGVNTIAGWKFAETFLSSSTSDGGIVLNSSDKDIRILTGSGMGGYAIRMGHLGSNKYGIEGKAIGTDNTVFKLGEDGNEIAGWTFDNEKFTGGNLVLNKAGFISSSNNWHISSSTDNSDPAGFISSSDFKVSADGRMTASAGKIGGWLITDDKLSAPNTNIASHAGIFLEADATPRIRINRSSSPSDNHLNLFYSSDSNWGIEGKEGGNRVFGLGNPSNTGNTIAGWSFDDTKLTGANITISSSGEIKTSNFISSMVGGLAGAGYRIGADGIAEFEEARIRGTLSTAVFEKETVSAVGGALIVANATALKSGSLILSASMNGQVTLSSSLEVDAANGFAVGEYILAKATSSNGFVEEIMKIHTVDTSNNILHVSRSMRGNLINSMSSGQVLVSQGKQDTGFILLNATSGSETPYIDIAERTGSGVDTVAIKARLGDLSGISDSAFSDGVTGYGLYTDNGYFKGKIEVAGGDLSTRPKSDYTIGLIATGSAGAPAYTSSIQYMYHTMGYTGGNAKGGQAGPNGTFFLQTSSSLSASDYYINGNPLDLYVSAHGAWGVGTTAEARQVLNLFDAGHSVLVMGNDTTTANATGSGETTWPITKHGNYAGGGGQNTIQWMRGYVATGSGLSLSDPIISGLDTTAEWSNYTSTDGAGGAKILKRNPGGGSTVVPIAVSGSTQMDATTSEFISGSGLVNAWYMTNPRGGRLVCIHQHDLEDITSRAYGYGTTDTQQNRIMDFLLRRDLSQEQFHAGVTTITGNMVKTGKIESTNWAANEGSQIDLNGGTIKLGGSSDPSFAVNAAGAMTASAGKIAGVTIGSDSFGNEALYVGGNTWGDSGTAFLVNKFGTFSLKDKLKWDGTTLNVSGEIAVTGGSITSSLADFPSDANLIAYYPLHNSVISKNGHDRVLDYSGNERHGEDDAGSISGGTTFVSGSTSGPLPGAAEFDGSDSRIDINAAKAGLTNGMDISLSFWIYHADTTETIPFGFHAPDSGDPSDEQNTLIWTLDDGDVNNKTQLHTNGSNMGFVTSTLEFTNTWRHVVLVLENGAAGKIYVDGNLMGTYDTANVNTSNFANITEILLGGELDAMSGPPTNDFTGKFSEWRIYNTALTADNARALFNQPHGPSSAGTKISGDRITTGNILSTNWSTSAGTNFNLNEGDLIIGGSTGQRFEFSGSANKMTFFSGSGAKAIEIDDTLVGDYAGIKITDGLLQVSNSVDMGNNDAAPLYSMNLNQTGGSSSNRKAAMFVITDNTTFDNGSITLTDFAPPISCPAGGAGKTGTGSCYQYGVGAAIVAVAETNISYGGAPRNAVAILASAKTGVDGSPQYSFYGKNGCIYNSASIMCGYSTQEGIADNRSDTLFSAYGADSLSDVDYYYLARTAGNTDVFYVDDSAVLYNAGEGRFTGDLIAYYSSDERMKDNIVDITNPLDKIKQIRGVTFDWNEKGPKWTKGWEGQPDGKKHDIGIIAQEIQKVLPEVVLERSGSGMLAVDYQKIVPLLIEGIKEQHTMIEDLQTRIKKLENK